MIYFLQLFDDPKQSKGRTYELNCTILFVSILRPVIGRHGSVWLYCFAPIGQGTLRPPADLSRVRKPQVCPCTSVHCTEAGLNSCITVPRKVCAPKVSMLVWESLKIQRLEQTAVWLLQAKCVLPESQQRVYYNSIIHHNCRTKQRTCASSSVTSLVNQIHQAKPLGRAKCVHKSRRKRSNSFSLAQIKKCQKRRWPYFFIIRGPCFLAFWYEQY
jgi:hypothetical protein